MDAKQRTEKLFKIDNIMTDNLFEMWNDPRLGEFRFLHSPEHFAYAQQSRVEAALGI